MYDIGGLTLAKSLQEAVEASVQHPDSVIIAGGSDVLIKLREGKLAGRYLVSIHDLEELHYIRMNESGDLEIGPLSTFRELEESQLIRTYFPVLGQAAGQVGGPQIRTVGTVGGNISNGVTSADTASTLMAVGARLTIVGPKGERELPISEYYVGPGRVALEHGEILTKITISHEMIEGWRGYYIKYGMRNAMDIATLGCVALAKLDSGKTHVEDLRLGFGVAAPVPSRALETEQTLRGLEINQALEQVADLVRGEIRPRDSWRASKAFRLQIAGEMARRALKKAIEMGGGHTA